MTKTDLIKRLRHKFNMALQTKERWSMSQIMKLFDSLIRDILFEDLEEEEQKNQEKIKNEFERI